MQKKDFKIENNIYPEEVIRSAINDFEGFEISFDKGVLMISGKDIDEIDLVFNEFMNYALGKYNENF